MRAHVSNSPISLLESDSAGLHARLYVPTLIASPMVTNRMIQSAAILIGERALSAKRRKAADLETETARALSGSATAPTRQRTEWPMYTFVDIKSV